MLLLYLLLDAFSWFLGNLLTYTNYRKYEVYMEKRFGYFTPGERCRVIGCLKEGKHFIESWVYHPPVSEEVKRFWRNDRYAPESVCFEDSLVKRMTLYCCEDPEHLKQPVRRRTVMKAHRHPTPEDLAEYAAQL